MLTCSQCKNATYCSKDCQRSHWKEHKPRCQIYQNSKARVKQEAATAAGNDTDISETNPRIFRLLQQFRDATRNEALLLALVRTFPDRATFLEQPSDAVGILEIKFDYNFQSFVPVKPADFIPDRKVLPEHVLAGPLPVSKTSQDGYVDHLLMLMYGKSAIAMPMRIPIEAFKISRNHSWEDINDMCRRVNLQSSAFDSFKPVIQINLKTQLSVVQTFPNSSMFLSCALEMQTGKSLHQKKVVVIEIELGFGLAEIKTLSSWKLETVSSIVNRIKNISSPAEVEYYKAVSLNLTSSCPYLSRADPGSAYCPIVFQHHRAGYYFVLPNCFVFDPSAARPPWSKGECRRGAQMYFEQLQALQLAPVQSPPL